MTMESVTKVPKAPQSVCVTGIGTEIPGIPDVNTFVNTVYQQTPILTSEDWPAIKGSRYKDRSTKLALLAAEAALLDANLPTSAAEQDTPERIGVVVSSNLGNIDTVCRVDEIIRQQHVKRTSAMDFPNLSSNIIPSSLAIQFRLKAINLMVCNGATSGLDALHLAANVIRAGRADRMVVVGVEPSDPVAQRLMQESLPPDSIQANGASLKEGAGAVVLESESSAQSRQAPIYGWLKGYGQGFDQTAIQDSVIAATGVDTATIELWLSPGCSDRAVAKQMQDTLATQTLSGLKETLDIQACLGEVYGALGVLQCIVACLWLKTYDKHAALMTSGATWGDPSMSLMLQR